MTRKLCSVDGCERPHAARGWCDLHYKRFLRQGDPMLVKRKVRSPAPPCRVSGCLRRSEARGLCKAHHQRYLRHGDPLSPIRPHRRLWCRICDDERLLEGFDPDKSTNSMVGLLGVGEKTIRLHRAHAHDPEWHAKRAAWWIAELQALSGEAPETAEEA